MSQAKKHLSDAARISIRIEEAMPVRSAHAPRETVRRRRSRSRLGQATLPPPLLTFRRYRTVGTGGRGGGELRRGIKVVIGSGRVHRAQRDII